MTLWEEKGADRAFTKRPQAGLSVQVRTVLGASQGTQQLPREKIPCPLGAFFTLTGKLEQTCTPSAVTTGITLSPSADGETQTRKEGGLLTMGTPSLHSFQTHSGTFSKLLDSRRPHPMTVHGTEGGEAYALTEAPLALQK